MVACGVERQERSLDAEVTGTLCASPNPARGWGWKSSSTNMGHFIPAVTLALQSFILWQCSPRARVFAAQQVLLRSAKTCDAERAL